jgi:chorismate mutase
MNLEDLRKKIDEIDARIIELIGERIRIAEDIGRGKKEQNKLVEDKEREYRVLENVKSIAYRKHLQSDNRCVPKYTRSRGCFPRRNRCL